MFFILLFNFVSSVSYFSFVGESPGSLFIKSKSLFKLSINWFVNNNIASFINNLLFIKFLFVNYCIYLGILYIKLDKTPLFAIHCLILFNVQEFLKMDFSWVMFSIALNFFLYV